MSEKDRENYYDKFINRYLLISSVQARPVLWNKNVENFKDSVARMAAWREICTILKDDFTQMGPKDRQMFKKCVAKRWSQIRDAWQKTLHPHHRSNKVDPDGSSGRKYKYYRELLFLKPYIEQTFDDTIEKTKPHGTIKNKTTDQDTGSEDSDFDQISISSEENITDEKDQNKTVIKYQKDSFYNPQKKTNRIVEENDERNLNFFKSAIPSLRIFDDDLTLEFHSGVINLIQTLRKKAAYTDTSRHYSYDRGHQNQYESFNIASSSAQPLLRASLSSQQDSLVVSTSLDPAPNFDISSNIQIKSEELP